ncbi:retropepsin-like aspartic protease family protein [Pinisolibacter sp.]|uniref:retropepsin-like aspartic protease family protein n=1 Tax=Pinisolibacter sp. TaxID=2172024 RepID=UPI002FDDE9A4
MYRNALRLTLFGAMAALMSPAWVPWLLHVVAFVTERPVAMETRAVGYRVEEGAGATARVLPSHGRTVTLKSDSRGHFLTEAAINGRAVAVMVDTGATSVALRNEDAAAIGVRPLLPSDYTVPIATANGTARAARVTLTEVRVGAVRVKNVEALVMPERALGTNLLGMSFIRRLRNVELASGRLTFVE